MKDKLKALRNMIYGAGVSDGERENARTLYTRLLKKYGLTDKDIAGIPEEKKETVWFKYKGDFEKRLIQQLVAKVQEDSGEKPALTHFTSPRYRFQFGYSLTEKQERLIRMKFKILSKALKKEIETCIGAFIQVNKLGLIGNGDDDDLTDEEKKEIEKMLYYAYLMQPEKIPETDPARLIG